MYQEHRFVSKFNLWMMFLGLLLILIGCALVGRRKTIKKHLDPGYLTYMHAPNHLTT